VPEAGCAVSSNGSVPNSKLSANTAHRYSTIAGRVALSAMFTFVPFFLKTNCSAVPCNANRTDVYASRVTPGRCRGQPGLPVPAGSSALRFAIVVERLAGRVSAASDVLLYGPGPRRSNRGAALRGEGDGIKVGHPGVSTCPAWASHVTKSADLRGSQLGSRLHRRIRLDYHSRIRRAPALPRTHRVPRKRSADK
jgi:hypothetical protein